MLRFHIRHSLFSMSAALALLSAAAAARAQSAPQAPSADGGLEDIPEIVVTARRHEENAQTVPVSVSVFDAAALANEGIDSTNDLQRLVPGVIFNGSGADANTTYAIRGQGKAVVGPGLPSVISYFNEVPLSSWGSVLPTFDVNNVQVLKGPQGTLFGRNTTGGAVLVYSNQPTFDAGGYIQGEFGNYYDHSFQGAVNVPVVDRKLAIRVAFDIERRDGYTRNVANGQKDDNLDSNAVRFSALAKPADWLSNSLVLDYYRSTTNSIGTVAISTVNPLLDAAVAAVQSYGPYSTASSVHSFDDETLWGISNTTKIDFNDAFSVKNIFGYRSTSVSVAGSGSGLDIAPLTISVPALGLAAGTPGVLLNNEAVRNDAQFTDELQFTGNVLNNSLTWLAGAFYLEDRPTGPNYIALDLYRPTQPSALTSYIVNNFLGGVWPVGYLSDNFYSDKSRAVFANLSYDLSDLAGFLRGLKLNGGVRYTWDTEGICANSRPGSLLSNGTFAITPYDSLDACRAGQAGYVAVPANAYFASYQDSANFHAPTYTLGVDYKVDEDLFLYFTTRRGYRAGGLNSPALAPILSPYQSYQPQTVTDYEVGAHTQWRAGDWRGRFNIAAFTGNFNNLQLQATGISAGGLPGVTAANAPSNSAVTLNVGSATVEGIEVGGMISPFRDLEVNYAGSYLNSHYNNLVSPGFLAPYFNSGPVPDSPRFSVSAEARYHLPVDATPGQFFVGADYYYLDKEYQGLALLPAYRLSSFNLQWQKVYQKPLDVTLFVDNAFDERYIHTTALSNTAFGLLTGNYGPPRMYGVRLRYSFGH